MGVRRSQDSFKKAATSACPSVPMTATQAATHTVSLAAKLGPTRVSLRAHPFLAALSAAIYPGYVYGGGVCVCMYVAGRRVACALAKQPA